MYKEFLCHKNEKRLTFKFKLKNLRRTLLCAAKNEANSLKPNQIYDDLPAPLQLTIKIPQPTSPIIFSSKSSLNSLCRSSTQTSPSINLSDYEGMQLFIDLPQLSPYTSLHNTTNINQTLPATSTTPSSPSNTYHMLTRAKTTTMTNSTFHLLSLATSVSLDTNEPCNIKEVLSKSYWNTTMHEEMQALHTNNTWQLVPRHSHMVGSRLVFKTKLKSEGSVECFKAHLDAKGYKQIE
nr:uncharacterized protein LOC117275274 [Nicotiana tomentosiformis]